MTAITNRYISFLRDHFHLDWDGIHGAPHWARVRANGLILAEQTSADPQVIEVFAFIHDVERVTDGSDPEHGQRAARLAKELNDDFFQLSTLQLQLLITACEEHSLGQTTGDTTILTCWDADRLDLGRVGVKPCPTRLCTEAAKQNSMIEWSYKRSISK
jgi:uncharacterized protein